MKNDMKGALALQYGICVGLAGIGAALCSAIVEMAQIKGVGIVGNGAGWGASAHTTSLIVGAVLGVAAYGLSSIKRRAELDVLEGPTTKKMTRWQRYWMVALVVGAAFLGATAAGFLSRAIEGDVPRFKCTPDDC